jgi:hypothetical protein
MSPVALATSISTAPSDTSRIFAALLLFPPVASRLPSGEKSREKNPE